MKPRSLASLIAGFKSATTASINTLRKTPGTPVWQRNYYEHIIRDQDALLTIRQYGHNNPLIWMQDQLGKGEAFGSQAWEKSEISLPNASPLHNQHSGRSYPNSTQFCSAKLSMG